MKSREGREKCGKRGKDRGTMRRGKGSISKGSTIPEKDARDCGGKEKIKRKAKV